MLEKLIPQSEMAVDMSKIFLDVHKNLLRFVALNAIFDVLSIPFWVYLPTIQQQSTQAQSTLTVDSSIAIINATVAAVLFALAFLGVFKRQKWGAALAVALTVAQRAIGVFMFQLNVGMVAMVAWSGLIVYFGYRELTKPKPEIPL